MKPSPDATADPQPSRSKTAGPRAGEQRGTDPDASEWRDAQPFREHVVMLMRTTGLHWRLIAAQAGVSASAMHHLLHGRDGQRPRQIHITVARSIMQIDIDDIAAAEHNRTYAQHPRELLHSLFALGYTAQDLRPWLTTRDLELATPRRRRLLYISVASCARIQACYDLLTSPLSPAQPTTRAAS